MSNKLKNVKAVKEMLDGKHKTQTKKTVSFADKVIERREVGETWTIIKVKSGNNGMVTKLKLENFLNSEKS